MLYKKHTLDHKLHLNVVLNKHKCDTAIKSLIAYKMVLYVIITVNIDSCRHIAKKTSIAMLYEYLVDIIMAFSWLNCV